MDPTVASEIARRVHAADTDRFGDRIVDHLARVAAAVPADARALAWLHDVLERTDTSREVLRRAGLTPTEDGALGLLTRDLGEPYEAHALRVALAPGLDGRLARLVKRADLDDHIAHARPGVEVPPYAWARRHIDSAQWRNHESSPLAAAV
jgi:hypothetical protein